MSVDTRTLWVDVVDNMYEQPGITNEAMDWLEKHIEEPVRALICEAKGDHSVVDDQCGFPEHRFCVVCGVRQPNAVVNAE